MVVTFGFAGCCAPGIDFSQKKLQKHLEVTAKVCNFALAFEKEAGQRPGTDSGLTTFPTIFWRKSLAEKKKSVTLRGCSGAPTRKAEKRTLTNIAIDKEVVQDKSGCGHAPQPESPVIS